MRYVVARKRHSCSACGDVIEEDEVCSQSESVFGRFFCEDCYTPKMFTTTSNTVIVKQAEEKLKLR